MNKGIWRRMLAVGGLGLLFVGGLAILAPASHVLQASPPLDGWGHHRSCDGAGPYGEGELGEFEGTWYWLRSPDQEKRVVAGLFNRYCIRCHGVDGRGVWDIPGIPNFTNVRWQASRSDAQIARIIQEGRGAVMPPFRGALTLEESYALARYLRTLVPGTEVSRPDFGSAPPAGSGSVPSTLPPPKVGPK
jgi:hypothetical protein